MVTGARKGLGSLAMALVLVAPSGASLAQGASTPPAQPAQAQTGANPAALADPDDVLLQELVVVGRDRGPAWWSVTNGTSTVYVLGAPSLAPKRTEWDTATLDRRLKGASQVILPFQDVKV